MRKNCPVLLGNHSGAVIDSPGNNSVTQLIIHLYLNVYDQLDKSVRLRKSCNKSNIVVNGLLICRTALRVHLRNTLISVQFPALVLMNGIIRNLRLVSKTIRNNILIGVVPKLRNAHLH